MTYNNEHDTSSESVHPTRRDRLALRIQQPLTDATARCQFGRAGCGGPVLHAPRAPTASAHGSMGPRRYPDGPDTGLDAVSDGNGAPGGSTRLRRLDRTTNWAVIVLAAVLTWAFSGEGNPHYLLLIGNLVLATFLTIEARRYRAYDIWRSRVRTLQAAVWAAGLDGSEPTDPEWRRRLADDYRTPAVKITMEEAVAHRLRRIYLPLLVILNAAWVVRVTAFGGARWPRSASIGMLSGVTVTAAVGVALLAAIALAFRPRTWHVHAELRTEELRNDGSTE